MKHLVRPLILALLLIALPLASLGEDAAELPTFSWLEGTWEIQSACINPDRVINCPDPGTQQYLMLRLQCQTGCVSTGTLIENLELMALEAPDGEIYPARAFMPYSIGFDERNGVFFTAGEQHAIEYFFVLPGTVDVATLTLLIDDEALCSLDQVPITRDE